MEDHRRLANQVVELERLDEIGVPAQRAIGDNEITQGFADNPHFAQAVFEYGSTAKNRTVILHRALHREADLARLEPSRGVAHPVEPCDSPGSTISAARSAAARPKTTRSSSELVPSRVAPCTETQAASPTAISPGTVRSGSSAVGSSTSA